MANDGGFPHATANQHEIELMKQRLLPSMSRGIEVTQTWLNESGEEGSCCIFKISQGSARRFVEACQPKIVSIGPYHYGESQLLMLQRLKWRYLHAMLGRTQPHGIHLENLINVVAPNEKMIRQCYSESTDDLSGPGLVEMMILDGCFIIELLRQLEVRTEPCKMLIIDLFVLGSVLRDLLRLENQVPYFVLKDLFETTNVPEGPLSLDKLALRLFQHFEEGPSNVWKRPINLKGMHLLDLIRLSLLPSDRQDNPIVKRPSYHLIKSASELRRVGIKFKQREASTFLDVKFDRRRRTIEIPKIKVYDDSLNWLLTNMVAFEQCRGQENGHMTTYAMFMGCLIRTANDVQLLRDCKVISNYGMSNEDFAHFFANVNKDVAFNLRKSYLASQFALLNESYKCERVYLCWAQLINAFNDNPWSVLSGLVVIVTLAGMIQTVYAVLQYYHPK